MGLKTSASACGRCHAYACVFVCICMRMRVCVSIYICAFFCSECRMHFGTGVLGTSALAGVYVTQVCFHTNVHICEHTRCKLCTYVYMYICVYMHAYAYGCICASMILLDALRRCCYDFLSVHTCAYAYVCICFCMHVCIVHVYMYVYVYMYVVYMYAYTFIYARVWVYIRTRVGAFCLFVLSNLSTTCACITGVS